MKNLIYSLLFCVFCAFCGSLPAQQTGEIKKILVEYASDVERTSTVLEKGHLVANDAIPANLYIGDGETLGGVLVTPDAGEWDHSATQDILLNGNRLQFGAGYSLISVGAYAALSGQGELQTDEGTSAWSINATPMIRVAAENILLNVVSLTWDATDEQFFLLLNVGANTNVPTIEGASDLVAGDWDEIDVGVTVGAYTAGYRTITIDYDEDWDIIFFRAVLSSSGVARVELLADTVVTGDLDVSGILTGDGSGLTNVGADLPATVSQIEAEAGTVTDLRSWTPERVKQAILALSSPTPRIINIPVTDTRWTASLSGGTASVDERGLLLTGGGSAGNSAIISRMISQLQKGVHENQLDFSKPIGLRFRFSNGAPRDGVSRVIIGKSISPSVGDLTQAGFGFVTKSASGVHYIQRHDGVSLAETATGTSQSGPNITTEIYIETDGAGNGNVYIDGVSAGTYSGFPTSTTPNVTISADCEFETSATRSFRVGSMEFMDLQ